MSRQAEPPPAPDDTPDRQGSIETDLTVQILAISAALIGVCVTILSIMCAFPSVDMQAMLIDELLAIDLLIFLVCCTGAYVALRMRKRQRQLTLERVIDILFLVGMALMALGSIGVVIKMG